jgi:23S rRNA U2552 (ribose-2'-O)-methylase RlmE/FtsJ
LVADVSTDQLNEGKSASIQRRWLSANCGLQEMSTAALHYCEMVTALGVLSPGGSFILKAFTLFEHPTVCALHLMGALFQEVHVYKPATSKPGNSETYIIGKQFKVTVVVCIYLTC